MNKSGISWTDYVFNAWIGCTKISPACKNCYAIPLNKRQGGNNWVEPPRAMADSNWDKLPRLNRLAIKEGKRLKVFCNMMSDIFDKNAPDGQRERFFQAIKEAPNLDIQLLTKRAVNIKKMLPDDWGNGYDNVCLGVTVENKKHGIPRIKYLKKVPAKIKFLSIEPLLEDLGELDLTGIDLVIVGGESGAKSKRRKMKKEWVYDIKRQCEEQGVTFYFKQWNGAKNKDAATKKEDSLLDGIQYHNWPSTTKNLDLEGELSQLFSLFPDKSKELKRNFKKSNRKLLKKEIATMKRNIRSLEQQITIMNQYSRSEVLGIVLDDY